MNKLFKNNRGSLLRKGGFTLIELLVVIAIISLLTGIITVSVSRSRAKARDTERVTRLQSIRKALEFYYQDKGVYPVAPTTNLKNKLVAEKLISSFNVSDLKYVSLSGSNTMCLSGTGCQRYQLGIKMERSDNPVLASDRDKERVLGWNLEFNGLNCAGTPKSLVIPAIDTCYDIDSWH